MTPGEIPRRLFLFLILGLVSCASSWVISYPFFSAWHDSLHLSRPNPTASATTSTTFESILLIWLDDSTAAQPQVEGLWLAQAPSDYSSLRLLGLPPAQFQDQYVPALPGVPLLSIQPYLRGPLAGTMIFDRNDVKEFANALGGVFILGQKTDGQGLLDYIEAADTQNPQDVLIRQGAAMQSLVAQLAVQGVQIDLARLLTIPSHSTLEPDKLYELVRHYYPLHTEQVRVEVAFKPEPVSQR